MTAEKLTYEEMEAKLGEAQEILHALRHHEVDAIVGDRDIALVRLQEVEEALHKAKAELEERVVERTAELAKVNRQLQETLQSQKRIQQQGERSARESREHAELLDLAHDMIFVHDMDGRIVFWNRGAELTYGWKREEAIGQLSHELLKTEFAEPLLRITARIIKEGWWEGELVRTTRAGRQVTVAARWALRRDAEGRPAAILEIDHDITARKQAEREMTEAWRFAESIIDTMQEALVVLDAQLRIISANRSFHETFGVDPQQIVGQSLPTLGSGLWADSALYHRLREVLMAGGSFEGFEIECNGGEPKAFVLSARPIRPPAHGAERILLVIQDVTLCKRQQRVIEADKEQLGSLTEELLMIEERQRRQIAQALHDSVGQSLAFSKRELNLLRQRGPEEVRGRLQEVCAQLDDAIKHTRDLTFELSPSTLYTLGLQTALEELAEQFAESEGFHCQVEGPGDGIPLSEQVRSLLYRAVRELLVNVAKHAEARNVRIILDHDEQGFRIAVQDDGKGFDISILKGRGKGRGFGMLSVRERLVHIGGAFAVESEQGQGTKVTMTIPIDCGQPSSWGFEGRST
ncbi:MAG: PAS domain S-box protein [Planctomycetes bacterium]|nr:PAS domain S-box protein [Planctomycetota bacterium]